MCQFIQVRVDLLLKGPVVDTSKDVEQRLLQHLYESGV